HEALIGYGGGFAQIFGPDGRALAKPLATDAEGILYADLDLSQIALAKQAADPVGHYSRPDVLSLQFNDRSLSVFKRLKDISEPARPDAPALDTAAPAALPDHIEDSTLKLHAPARQLAQ